MRAFGCEVRVQEDFQQGPGSLLQELQDYISQCDRVVALVGDAYGTEASGDSVPPDRRRRSYTQWEYFFALGERLDGPSANPKALHVYFASESFLAEHEVAQIADYTEALPLWTGVRKAKDFA